MEEEKNETLFKDKKVVVIQYLQPSMSTELLCKFPDNSAFDFDYSQSSIWSPLVPRFHSLSCLNPKSPDLNRRLSFDKASLSSKINKKVCNFGLNLNAKFQKKMNNKKLKFTNDSSEFQSPPSKKGWKKILKISSKQFKKRRDAPPHRHPISRVTLSDFLQSKDF
ncbi:Serine/threonine-protein kinase phg2 [Bienertia sinuspersici]